MAHRNATRTQLLTAAFLVLTALTSWSLTSIVHPDDVQLTLKRNDPSRAPATGATRAVRDQHVPAAQPSGRG